MQERSPGIRPLHSNLVQFKRMLAYVSRPFLISLHSNLVQFKHIDITKIKGAYAALHSNLVQFKLISNAFSLLCSYFFTFQSGTIQALVPELARLAV